MRGFGEKIIAEIGLQNRSLARPDHMTQITQWDFQNKGKSCWTDTSSFVLEVLLLYLRPSIIYSVPCDRILQRAY